jgi:hypothetical protein
VKFRYAAVAGSLLMAVTACAQETGSDSAVPAPSREARTLRLPFDVYEYSPSEQNTYYAARDVLVTRCMKRADQPWTELRVDLRVADLRNRRHYGVIEEKVAEKYGYHAPPALRGPAESRKAAEQIEQQTAYLSDQAFKVSEECAVRADREIYGGKGLSLQQLNGLKASTYEDSEKQPGTAKAMSTWRDCMQKAGFRYPSSRAANNSEEWWEKDSDDPSSDREKEVAVADVRCKHSAGLISAWHTDEARLQNAEIKKNADYFARLLEHKKASLERCRKIIASAS